MVKLDPGPKGPGFFFWKFAMVVWVAEIEDVAEHEAMTGLRWRMATARDWRRLTKEQPEKAKQLREELLRKRSRFDNDIIAVWVLQK